MPAAAVLSRYRFRSRGLMVAILTMPFVLPTVVVATAFRSLGIEGSLLAIVVAHTFFNVAIVVRVVGVSWRGLERRMMLLHDGRSIFPVVIRVKIA